VTGTNFVPGSLIRWNGTDLPTTLNGGLIAQVPAGDIATGGTAAVTVLNPTPGGGVSNPLTFTVATGGVGPKSLAVDPTGKFAYVANSGLP
jgi:DNA-binding beta-propeller fold protein YncE